VVAAQGSKEGLPYSYWPPAPLCICQWVYLVKANVLMNSQYYILG
jgi:hypothetical protein